MTRTSEAISMVAADVEGSQDNATWIDLGPYGSTVGISGGDRRTGEINVFDDERPIVKAGKKASQVLTIRYVYTEELEAADGPFDSIRTWDDTEGGTIYARYWPEGKTAGNFIFRTGKAILTSFLDPGGEAGSGEVVVCEITITMEELSKDTWLS